MCLAFVFGLVIFLLSWLPMYNYSSWPAVLDTILDFILEHRVSFHGGNDCLVRNEQVSLVGFVLSDGISRLTSACGRKLYHYSQSLRAFSIFRRYQI